MHFTDPLQPLPEYRSVLSRKTSYQENGNIQQKYSVKRAHFSSSLSIFSQTYANLSHRT